MDWRCRLTRFVATRNGQLQRAVLQARIHVRRVEAKARPKRLSRKAVHGFWACCSRAPAGVGTTASVRCIAVVNLHAGFLLGDTRQMRPQRDVQTVFEHVDGRGFIRRVGRPVSRCSRCIKVFWSRSATCVLSFMVCSSNHWRYLTVIARGEDASRLPTVIDRQPLV